MKRINISTSDIKRSIDTGTGKPCAHCAIEKSVGRVKHRRATLHYVDATCQKPYEISVGRQVYRAKGNLARLSSGYNKSFAIVLDDTNGTAQLGPYEESVESTTTL